jgi:hypothetical protein
MLGIDLTRLFCATKAVPPFSEVLDLGAELIEFSSKELRTITIDGARESRERPFGRFLILELNLTIDAAHRARASRTRCLSW